MILCDGRGNVEGDVPRGKRALEELATVGKPPQN